MSSDLRLSRNWRDSTLHSQSAAKQNLVWISPERGQQKWAPVLRHAIKLAQIA